MIVNSECTTCGAHFHYVRNGSGRKRKYCSAKCKKVFDDSKIKAKRLMNRKTPIAHTDRVCVVCGAKFRRPNPSTVTCGPECGTRRCHNTRSANADNKRFERTGRRDDSDLVHRREKAEWKRRGDNIDRIKLFERDGWRCYICGDQTPKELIGSHRPKAPEVDHIIPFAAGGQHTWVNTACACRFCNSKKKASLTTMALVFMELGLF